MKSIITVLVALFAFIATLKAQQNFSGNWQVYDTLSFTQTKLGDMVLNKVKLLHKKLTLNNDGSFYMHHIEPKGFFIDADVSGTWKVYNGMLVLEYENEYENQQGIKQTEIVKDNLLIVDESKLSFTQDEKTFLYLKQN